MIYVLESSAQKIFENGKKELYTIYKVGGYYPRTPSNDYRRDIEELLRLYNPTANVVLILEKATREDEKNCFKYLEDLGYKAIDLGTRDKWYSEEDLVDRVKEFGKDL